MIKNGFNKFKDWLDGFKPEVREVKEQLKDAQTELESKKYSSAAKIASGAIEKLSYVGINRDDSGYYKRAKQILSDAKRKAT